MSKTPIRRLAAILADWCRSWRRPSQIWAGWALVALLLAALVGPAAPAAQATEAPRVLPQLLREAAREPERAFRVIVQRRGGDRAADRAVAARGYKKVKEVAADGFVAEVKGRDLAALGQHKAVKWVTPDAVMVTAGAIDFTRLATVYNQAINAAQLWSAGFPVTGAGVGVAVLDTGINPLLPDFRDVVGGSRVIKGPALKFGIASNDDGNGHGTHVAGIIGGNSWWRLDPSLRGKYIGVAPQASLINVAVADNQGMAYLSDVVDALEWVIANREKHNIRVLNLSLLSSVAESYTTSVLDAAVERAWFSGILVVVAAGNLGPDSISYPPANDPFVVTVGAADPLGTAARADDAVAPWSSYGTSQDGVGKPDLVAPGRYMAAPLTSSFATLATAYPDRIVDGGKYIWLSGTSMAAPVVSGLAALAFQAHPEWTNDQVKWLLAQTATRLGTTSTSTSTDPATGAPTTSTVFAPHPGQGAGLVDATAVVGYAGAPGYANQGLTISSQLVGPEGATAYSNSSWSTSSWSTSSWSTASWSTSSWSTSSWSTSSWSTASPQAAVE